MSDAIKIVKMGGSASVPLPKRDIKSRKAPVKEKEKKRGSKLTKQDKAEFTFESYFKFQLCPSALQYTAGTGTYTRSSLSLLVLFLLHFELLFFYSISIFTHIVHIVSICYS